MSSNYQQGIIDRLHTYEMGELSDEETIMLFQELIDTALVWDLQGHYGRTAINLINQGLITAPRVTKDEVLNGHNSY